MNITPWPHQLATIEKSVAAGMLYDMSDPGIGKTLAHLGVYEQLGQKRCLVSCPKTLMRSAWGNEIKRYFPDFGVTFADAGARSDALASRSEIVVVNHDGVKDLVADLPYIKREFDTLIIDEVTAYKNPTTQRSKAMLKLAKGFKHVFVLSGTPTANSVVELWHPMMLVDKGKRLGKSYSQFRNAVQISEQVGPLPQHRKWVDRPLANEAAFRLIDDVTIRHAFEDVMTHVPPNHKQIIEFDLSKKMRAHYRKLEDECVLALEKRITPVHASALRQKLLQVCCLAGETEVLCARGWVRIDCIQPTDTVWDGIEWVPIRGSLMAGEKPVVECYGVRMTADHKVLTKSGWTEASEILHGNADGRFDRAPVRTPCSAKNTRTESEQQRVVVDAMRLRQASSARVKTYDVVDAGPRHRFTIRGKDGVPFIVHNSGAVYYDNGEYEVLDTWRYDLITEIIEEREQSVVAFRWTHQRDMLVDRLKKAGISFGVIDGTTPASQRETLVDQFQAHKLRVLLMHPKTGAHGLTLTAGTTTIISSPIYEADLLKQFIHRIYRGAQDKVTNTLLIRAADTVEEFVYDQLFGKTDRMEDFLHIVAAHKGR